MDIEQVPRRLNARRCARTSVNTRMDREYR